MKNGEKGASVPPKKDEKKAKRGKKSCAPGCFVIFLHLAIVSAGDSLSGLLLKYHSLICKRIGRVEFVKMGLVFLRLFGFILSLVDGKIL